MEAHNTSFGEANSVGSGSQLEPISEISIRNPQHMTPLKALASDVIREANYSHLRRKMGVAGNGNRANASTVLPIH